MQNVIMFPSHYARASAGLVNPKTQGSASKPSRSSAALKTKICADGILPRAFQLETAFSLTPASSAARRRPPTALITSETLQSAVITERDTSHNVSLSSPHSLAMVKSNETPVNTPMYSRAGAAKRLIRAQEALGMTNAALAERAGVTPHAWSQYRTGDRAISPQALVMLKEQFGVTTDWILANDPSGLPHKLYAKLLISAA